MFWSSVSRLERKDTKIYGSKTKGLPGSGMELNPLFMEIKWNKGGEPSEQNCIKLRLLFMCARESCIMLGKYTREYMLLHGTIVSKEFIIFEK